MASVFKRWIVPGGAAVVLAVAAAAALAAFGPGRASLEAAPAPLGAARHNSLTVQLAPTITETIYGGPNSQGRPIVVIDAGHGGHDPGANGVSGEVEEKALTLAFAREIRDELVRRGRVRVAMTRDSDAYMTLEDRSAVARRLGASLFLSLHMDSAPNPLARGASIYSLSDVASDAEAERFARRENARGGATASAGSSVESMLSELALRGQMNASADLAARVVRRGAGHIAFRPEPHRFAAFHVLRGAGTAAILFEAGYLSNSEDEALLRSPEYRARMVSALARAIEADIAARSLG